jgi:GLPGLI family protein
MKKILLLLILFSKFYFAQTQRVIYELKYKPDSTQVDFKEKYMVLDINPNETKYYDYSFLKKDSINKKFNTQNLMWTDQIPIIRESGSNKNINFGMIDFQCYKYVTNDVINWNITQETRKHEGLNLQKAEANFGGRKWTAWFSKDFSFNEGPYKFHGLPGLIILLSDSKDNYLFSFVQSYHLPNTYDTSNFLEVRYGNSPILVKENIFRKKKVEYFNNPVHEIKTKLESGESKSVDFNGVRYTNSDQLRPIIIQQQNYMKKNNNPIELNKAFNFSSDRK